MSYHIILLLYCFVGIHADILKDHPTAGSCLCLNTTVVKVSDTACGNVIGSTSGPKCFISNGNKVSCAKAGKLLEWVDIEYGGHTGWITDDYVEKGDVSLCSGYVPPAGNCGRVKIVTRAQWGAKPIKRNIPDMPHLPVNMSFIHHTATPSCTDQEACSARMRSIQDYHMSKGWGDIGYSFLVGEDGQAYEGRGLSKTGAHTLGYNDVSVGVAVIGNFMKVNPNKAAMDAVVNILDCAVKRGFLRGNYEMFGHRDGGYTDCPGDTFYETIRHWPHYSTRKIPKHAESSVKNGINL